MQRVQIYSHVDRGVGDNDLVHHGDHDDAEHGDLDDDKVSVVGWCGACVACCFSGKGLCTLFGKLPSVCKVNFSFPYLFTFGQNGYKDLGKFPILPIQIL